jgi:hypothetical protein
VWGFSSSHHIFQFWKLKIVSSVSLFSVLILIFFLHVCQFVIVDNIWSFTLYVDIPFFDLWLWITFEAFPCFNVHFIFKSSFIEKNGQTTKLNVTFNSSFIVFDFENLTLVLFVFSIYCESVYPCWSEIWKQQISTNFLLWVQDSGLESNNKRLCFFFFNIFSAFVLKPKSFMFLLM